MNTSESLVLKPGTEYRFEQEVWFDNHLYGSDTAYPNAGQVEIRQGSTGDYWNGTAWQAAQVWLTTSVDASGLFHYYDFTVPPLGQGQTIVLRMRVTGDSATEKVATITAPFQMEPWFPFLG